MSKQKNVARMAVVLTVCGALLLIVAVGSLVLRCRTLEFRLNEMYLESLTAHTGEAGEGAGYLIHYGETALKNIDLLIEEESRAPEKGWVAPVVNTFNLVDDRMELSYLDRRDMEGRIWGSEGPELVRRVLSGEPVVSGLISDQGHESSYVVVAHPVEWDGQVVGALQARMRAETLLHQGKHSTFFHSVHSVIAGEDGRVVYGSAGGRDLASLRGAAEKLPNLKDKLSPFSGGRLGELARDLDCLEDVYQLLCRAIVDEPPFSVREGGFIRDGYDAEVDRLRGILSGGKGVIAEVEAREKEKTGIKSLKVGYNKVFGYYIEVSKSYYDLVPETYIRKQTLANCERFITQELKDLEHTVLTANDRVTALEYDLFTALRQRLGEQMGRIQAAAGAVGELDALCSLASAAVKNNYCRPEVDEGGVIEIHDGRHPVVERMLRDALFVPNDTFMGEQENRVAIITGPNMAGKSTYMRQVALIVLMAQVGSFVPARSARIGAVDRIFTRIGASDDLSAGQSTFMVEMTEVSDILRHATSRSLLILDEIGRGTSTFDGMSIAQAVLEYCGRKLGAKTLFATHYHELTELEGSLPGAKNYNIAIKSRGDDIVFLRKIVPGGADRSYGIEVAKLAGLPDAVVKKARAILKDLEGQSGKTPPLLAAPREEQVSLTALGEAEVIDRLRRTQPDTLTPIEAMGLLYELKQKLQ